MAKPEKIVVLDFGGQYNQLIARRVRESGVYCEILNYAVPMEQWRDESLRGIILTGGPNSVYAEGAPAHEARRLLASGRSGAGHLLRHAAHQLHLCGGKVESADGARVRPHRCSASRRFRAVQGRSARDGGVHEPHRPRERAARGLSPPTPSHGQLPHRGVLRRGTRALRRAVPPRGATTPSRARRCCAISCSACAAAGAATAPRTPIERMIAEIRAAGRLRQGRRGPVRRRGQLRGLRASPDRALKPDQLTCVFVDHGLLRKNEAAGGHADLPRPSGPERHPRGRVRALPGRH